MYYLYCLCKSVQRSLVSRLLFFSESGCKGKNFKAYLPNIFGSFFYFSFFSFLVVSLVEREAKRKRKKNPGHRFLKEECQLALLSFSKAGAKVRTLKHNFQMFFEKYFYLFLFLCVTFHTSVSVFQSYHFPSLGKRVQRYRI